MEPETFAIRADLHTHSTASDGLDSPAELVSQASERGISVLAITDHDTAGGVEEARAAASRAGVELIAGVEFSIRARRGQTHILGYGIDIEHPALSRELLELREGREERGRRMIERLRDLGIDVPIESVTSADPGHAPGRPHVARALVDIGLVSSVSEAFEKYLAVGRPAFVPRRTLTAEAAIDLIHQAGGLAVLAHPLSVFDLIGVLPGMISSGLDGLEAYYGEYDPAQRTSLVGIAARHGLLVTGGSDYHGEDDNPSRRLGSVCWPAASVEAILKRLN